MSITLRSFTLLACAVLMPLISQAQTPAPSATPPPEKDLHAWVASQLADATKHEAALNEKSLQEELKKNGLPETMAVDFLSAAHDIVRNYQTASDVLNSLSNNQHILADLKGQKADAPPPKTEDELNPLLDKIESLRLQLETAETQIRIDDANLTHAQTALESSQQQYRSAVEDLDAAAPDAKNRATLLVQLADLRQQATSAAVFLASQRISSDEIDQQVKALTLSRLDKAVKASGLDSIFNQQRAQNALIRIAKNRDSMGPQIDEMRKAATALNDTVTRLNQDLETARQAKKSSDIAALTTRLTVASEAANLANSLVTSQEGWLNGLNKSEEAWKKALAAGEKPILTNLQNLRQYSEGLSAEIDLWRDQIPRSLQDIQRRLEEAETQPPSKDSSLRKLEETRVDLLRKRAIQLRDISVQVANEFRTQEQMVNESREKIAEQAISERAVLVGKNVASDIKGLWNQPLFTIKDEIPDANGNVITRERSITLGKLFLAIVWLLIALAVSKLVSKTVSGRLGKRFAIDPARISGIEKALFFPLALLLVLTTLNWLHIPLATFAFLGGALAIGVGFGAQTLINNFISGLILLSERRIKVGDTIEVDSHTGAVTNLGTRCSRILKGNGVEVLIPNSYLLEKNVVNWTLSNNRHSFDFAVGLSYGTSIEQALALLRKAVSEESKVLEDPAPCIAFEDFGASALIFRVYYWVDLRGADNRIIGTNIRMRIDRLCRDAGIVIASPGQDVRLRTSDPLTIRIEEPRNRA
jgi:potassium-dependent mechanosensitive channel